MDILESSVYEGRSAFELGLIKERKRCERCMIKRYGPPERGGLEIGKTFECCPAEVCISRKVSVPELCHPVELRSDETGIMELNTIEAR
jgi:hypothetical protein